MSFLVSGRNLREDSIQIWCICLHIRQFFYPSLDRAPNPRVSDRQLTEWIEWVAKKFGFALIFAVTVIRWKKSQFSNLKAKKSRDCCSTGQKWEASPLKCKKKWLYIFENSSIPERSRGESSLLQRAGLRWEKQHLYQLSLSFCFRHQLGILILGFIYFSQQCAYQYSTSTASVTPRNGRVVPFLHFSHWRGGKWGSSLPPLSIWVSKKTIELRKCLKKSLPMHGSSLESLNISQIVPRYRKFSRWQLNTLNEYPLLIFSI